RRQAALRGHAGHGERRHGLSGPENRLTQRRREARRKRTQGLSPCLSASRRDGQPSISVRDLLRNVVLWVRRRLALRRVARVSSHDDGARRILCAVEQTLRGELSPEEREWVRRIEELRKRLRHSHEPVTLTDFGAGGTGE